MNNSTDEQKQNYINWATKNLGKEVGNWYAPYLERLGTLLEKFNIELGLYDNFFEYKTYSEYKIIYQKVCGDTNDSIEEILKAKPKRYTNDFVIKNDLWADKFAEMEFNQGIRNKADNRGGIAYLGPILRAYLKYLYYSNNPELKYPKKKKITYKEIDDNINYWVYAPGEEARQWDEFYSLGVLAIGWDFLNSLNQYESRMDMEKAIMAHNDNGKKPFNISKATWEFRQEIKPGDIVYAKSGTNSVIGKGFVTGEYYFDDTVAEYKHRRKINWTNKGTWVSEVKIPIKTLTNLCYAPETIIYLEKLINDVSIEPDSILINEFRTWLSQQLQSNGEHLDEKIIDEKIEILKDFKELFNVNVFEEKDIEVIKNIKENIIIDNDKDKTLAINSIDYYIRYIESRPVIEENEQYFLGEFLDEVFIEKEDVLTLQSILQNKKNLILKGAPGVGKTFIADRLAYLMMEEKDNSRIQMIQFHQSYSYEDFIEGYRPKAEGDGFELKQGPFVKFSRMATRDPERNYFFIIDEINRGNMSKVFGELMMLIETDKRGKSVNLLYSNEKFSVPENLYIIGMMNTADRSLALLDYALRRRFAFFEMNPAFENKTFKSYLNTIGNPKTMLDVISEIRNLNNVIVEELGKGFQIGHSYFSDFSFALDTNSRVNEVIEFEIIPQLYEYWFDDEQKAEEWATRLRNAANGN